MTKSNGISPGAPPTVENLGDDDLATSSSSAYIAAAAVVASPTSSSMTSSPQPQQPLLHQQPEPEQQSSPALLNNTRVENIKTNHSSSSNVDNNNNNSTKQQQSSSSPSSSSLSAAADLIKTLDAVYAEVNHSAVTTARDAEEARRNARAASEVARRYGYQSSSKIPPGAPLSSSASSSIPLSLSLSSSRPNSPPTFSTPAAAAAAAAPAAASTTPTGYYFSSPPSPGIPMASSRNPYTFQRPPSRYGYSTSNNFNIVYSSQQYHHHNNVTTSTPSSCNTSVSGGVGGNKDLLMTSTHSSNSLKQQGSQHDSQHTAPSLQNLLSSPPQSEQQQAEEVLTLSLELERARQNLQAETLAHQGSQQALHIALEKNESLERQMDKLVNDRETEQEAYRTRLEDLQVELTASRKRFVAAEDDAQFALELAKGNASAREQLEEQLQRALHEIQMLRLQQQQSRREFAFLQQQHASKHRVVRFADEVNPHSTINSNNGSILHSGERHQQTTGETGHQLQPQTAPSPASSSSRPLRSMVAAGRQLFQQSSAVAAKGAGSDSDQSNTLSSSSRNPMHSAPSPSDFAAKRRQQKERLRALSLTHPQLYIPSSLSPSNPPPPPPLPSPPRDDSTVAIAAHGSSSPSTSVSPRLPPRPPPPNARHSSSTSTELLDTCRTAARVLKESGKRLNLSGQWWTSSSSNIISSSSSPGSKISANDMHLDAMARHYCTAVEVILDRKQKEVIELESLNALLESSGEAPSSSAPPSVAGHRKHDDDFLPNGHRH